MGISFLSAIVPTSRYIAQKRHLQESNNPEAEVVNFCLAAVQVYFFHV